MEALIERIQLAVADDASTEAKQSGAEACRAILAALEAQPGQALAAQPPSPLSMLAGLDGSQILDLVIARLRALVPEQTAEELPGTLRVQLASTRDVRGEAERKEMQP